MKKLFNTLIIAMLVLCTCFASACSLFNPGNEDENTGEIVPLDYEQSVAMYEVTDSRSVEYSEIDAILTTASNATNATAPNVQKGVTVAFSSKQNFGYVQGGITMTLTMSDFIMHAKTVKGKIIAEGMFNMALTATGYLPSRASVKFYYDGTYFGMHIVQDGYPDDKQQSRLNLWTSLDNLIGTENYFENMLAAIPQNVDDIREYKEQAGSSNYFIYTREDGKIDINVAGLRIIFDENYNIIATVDTTFNVNVQSFVGRIEMPEDWDTSAWIKRN